MSSPILDRLDALDRRLTRHGFPGLSPWWRETLVRFYGTSRRQLVLRVGRRGGKSSTLARIAVLEGLYGAHHVPRGDVGIVGIVSVSRDEANQRLRTIKAILDTLDVAYRPIEGGIELTSRPVAFKVFAATMSGVVGGTWICGLLDEVARWKDAESGVNPAREVIASLRPTMATQPNARLFLSSSPLSTLDAHHDAFELGDTEVQLVAHAPSWVANPTLDRATLRREEPDARIFAREYEAIPMSALAAAFDPDAIDRAMRDAPSEGEWGRPVMVLDPSSGRGDAFTSAFVQWLRPEIPIEAFERRDEVDERGHVIRVAGAFVLDPHGNRIVRDEWRERVRPQLVVSNLLAWEGRFFGTIPLEEIVGTLARECHVNGVRQAFSDQREAYALEAAFRRNGVRFESIAWTSGEKGIAVERLRRLFAECMIVLPKDEALRRELVGFSERVLPSGTVTYGARSSGKDDRVALLLTACMADALGGLALSPIAITRGRNDRFVEHRQTITDTAN